MGKITLQAWSFNLRFGRDEEYGDLFIAVLDDYLKNIDYTNISYDDLKVAEWISRIFYELKSSSEGGNAECMVNGFILEKLPDIVLAYRDQKKGPHYMLSSLWLSLKDMATKTKEFRWG